MKRTALKRKTPLRAKTPMRRSKPIRQRSPRRRKTSPEDQARLDWLHAQVCAAHRWEGCVRVEVPHDMATLTEHQLQRAEVVKP